MSEISSNKFAEAELTVELHISRRLLFNNISVFILTTHSFIFSLSSFIFTLNFFLFWISFSSVLGWPCSELLVVTGRDYFGAFVAFVHLSAPFCICLDVGF